MLCRADGAKGEAASGSNREGESTDAERRGGAARRGMEGSLSAEKAAQMRFCLLNISPR